MVGSSIVKNAFIVARQQPGGINLGLSIINVEIWWQGIRGLVIEQIMKQIVTMLQYEDPPNYIFLHVSANSIGHSKIGHIRNQLKVTINWIHNKLPKAIIIWSQILPRFCWRYSSNLIAMEKCRYRLNNSIASYVLRLGGRYIRYQEIKAVDIVLQNDGVHLTNLANELFLNSVQGGLEMFIQEPSHGPTFPN